MLHFAKFRQELFSPATAREVYVKRAGGRGWPEECPPVRAANAFGYDLLANFDLAFVRDGEGWRVEDDVVIESDFDWSAESAAEEAEGSPLVQQYAWFWERGQELPHKITDEVWAELRHQVKVSSFLYLKTDPNELLYMTEVPNYARRWRAVTALVDTDWYPAGYPWHAVIELDPAAERVEVSRGEPICRVVPVRRDTYFAQEMSPAAFGEFFDRGQRWLAAHGKLVSEGPHEGTVDLRRTYVRQQVKSRFVVMT